MIKHNTIGKGAYRKSHARVFVRRARSGCVSLLTLALSACMGGPAIDLTPDYQPEQFILPDSWRGSGPFAKANPSEGELRPDWWKLYDDPVLNELEKQAMEANPDLHAAAERFIQARAIMMKVRSRLIPQLGVGFGASNNKQSEERLFRGLGEPDRETTLEFGGLASWEPDFWSRIRNRTRMKIYRAEQRAAEYILARLSLQAEVATNYYTLRSLDGQAAILSQSVNYYKDLLGVVEDRFNGAISPKIDVTRTQFLLFSTEARLLNIQAQRQVIEHALAVLVNRSASSFKIEPLDEFPMAKFQLPVEIPSTLLERRPDIAAMERKMAQANRTIGIARAAFYPHISFGAGSGFEGGTGLFDLAKSFWSYGLEVRLPIFQGGHRRARLQQAWSVYRETVDDYRSTVLNAFREVENGLSRTNLISAQVEKLITSVEAALETQNLTVNLYQGGLATSLDLLFAQINTLDARIEVVRGKAELMKSSVELVRALGGGWNREQLPTDEQIQPFGVLQYNDLGKPQPVGGIDAPTSNDGRYSEQYDDLTQSIQGIAIPAGNRGETKELIIHPPGEMSVPKMAVPPEEMETTDNNREGNK
ncbi:efflux transporter outer membrane subunit [Nitrosococcus oceani]|uniref:RND efflux system, outer membrane lipoprotein, NodT n=2 Tax=Nitrosococcus oceani TaxID=1229 RepID=Q3JBM1_NITOC|nr:efflux transporter outer membrane subunit [Nitrosococcus oceani]KFI19792.1 secretion protein [Nitrosococcus oceani C-27]ABA57775.1 RND efflux system, outer membrane lipoprotein, NodT [Nitrosococcus oceani ATCC 19707]EDZ67946.1 efflux transporter, outer membrane factor lipoprotein, NodT family [Nitrosococcus oceani AFC27]KFI23004.1 secretion protein [Nitrosococcus oceani]GEM19430.1 secretion protein [Nitrosococcus oceani]